MKTPHGLRKSCLATILALVWLSLALPLHGQVTQNPDGGTTTTEPVDFGPKPKKGEFVDPDKEPPFYGRGEQRTTRDKDGNITKVDWVKKGRTWRAWFFRREGQNVVVTGYDYDPNGKPTSKKEQSFDRITGKTISKDDEKLKPNGEVDQGKRMRLEDGKWVEYKWNPKSETWVKVGVVQDPETNETLQDFLKKHGIQEEPAPGHGSAGGVRQERKGETTAPAFPSDSEWKAMTPDQRWEWLRASDQHRTAFTPAQQEIRFRRLEEEMKPSTAREVSSVQSPFDTIRRLPSNWEAMTPADQREWRREERFQETLAKISRWSLSVGTIVQRAEVSFSFSNRAEDFGLFTEGSTQVYGSGDTFVQYEDGSVSELDAFAQANGFATFSGGEVTATGTAQIGLGTVNTIDATFHSTVIDENGGDSSKDKTFVKLAPSIELDYTVKQCEKGKVSLFSQYAFYNVNQSSGTVNGDIRGQLHTFTYAGIDQPAGPDRIFFDPTVINGPPFNATPPFAFPVHMISDLRTRSHADLDLQQHQFTFGARAWLPGKWSGLNVVAGPTLTVSSFDYNARTDLWMGDTKWTSNEVSDSGQSAQFGFMAQAGARLDLWHNVSLDVYGRYDFVDQLKIGNSSAKATLGNNSYGGGVSVNWSF